MIKVSHECPLCLMEKSRSFNDYDYALVHLFKDNPKYKQFFVDSLKMGRQVLLDNSVFELDEPFNPDKFVDAINDLAPTWYVVPDFLDNKDCTISSMENWISDYLPKIKVDSKIIGSIQGKNLSDIVDCYKYMSEKPEVSKIAITFNSQAYDDGSKDVLNMWCSGRIKLIGYLVDNGIWNMNKPHHLLGASLISEFSQPIYHKISIETLDTSNPVMCGVHGIRYGALGNKTKPKQKLCDILNEPLTDRQLADIDFNVWNFKNFSN